METNDLTVVGIGASAGGLQALQDFFGSLPDQTGMAYVVITHLHPEHESHMAELLQAHTTMPVRQVTGATKVEGNHVYVIPPNRRIVMADGKLDVEEFDEPRGQRTPVDHFFRSLAKGHSNSVAVILSGGGTDGAVGIKDVKEQGGLLLVQQPEQAEHDGMPRAAIATGLADLIAPAQELAEKLATYILIQPQLPRDAEDLQPQQLHTIRQILTQVHAQTGNDFSQYKRSTVYRRIRRRMQLHGLATLESYLEHLRRNPMEATAMFNDILINVTNFFRDRPSWQSLADTVIPSILEGKQAGDVVRVWSVGCATGEEAYGLAILLHEQAAKLEIQPRIQIFASDLHEGALRIAREGRYPAVIEADVSPERLERFFIREGDHYRIRRELRDTVLFTSHSLLRDAPFSRLDLVSCRNVLIYLNRDIQNNVFDIFHYALKTGGYLFLGDAESADVAQDLFETLDKPHRIYRTRAWNDRHAHIPSLPLSVNRPSYTELLQPAASRLPSARAIADLDEQHREALEANAPPSVLIDEKYTILHTSETAGRYLLQPKGPITSDLIRLVRPELRFELRAALFRVFEKSQAVNTPPTMVRFNGHARQVMVSIRPHIHKGSPGETELKQALVMFLEDEQELSPSESARDNGDTRSDTLVPQLEAEIRSLREQLQVSVEGQDSYSEEMKASNEELQSLNEEYRSATEELETSKEELQSMNEELQTVNSELKLKLDEISRSHSDLQNLMSATEIATLFLDRDLRIRHFTPGVKELFNIMPTDRGRPLRHLRHTLQYDRFIEDAEEVLRTLVPLEHEIWGENGEWLLLRMRPYRTTDDRIEGVIFTFVDITRLKKAEEELVKLNATLEQRVEELDQATQEISQTRDMFYRLFEANPVPTALIRAEDDVILDVNAEFLNYFGLQREKIIGHSAQELGLELGPESQLSLEQNSRSEPATREKFIARIKQQKIGNYEMQVPHPSGEVRSLLESVQYIRLESNDALITTFIDITERVIAEQKIRRLAADLTGAEQAERHRLSQILHDDLQQRLFAVQMQLSFLRDAYEKNDLKAFRVDFPQLDQWLVDAIKVTRRLSVDLSPPILRGEGLVEAIIWLAAQMDEQYGLKVEIRSKGTPAEIEEKVRILVFYAVRELLFNVVKHAGTKEAAVRFEHYDSRLLVIVRDHGIGFDSSEVMNDPHMAHGLWVIKDRLSLLGCKMDVNAQPGNGTETIIEVPYGPWEV